MLEKNGSLVSVEGFFGRGSALVDMSLGSGLEQIVPLISVTNYLLLICQVDWPSYLKQLVSKIEWVAVW